jgi:hypothetical protein
MHCKNKQIRFVDKESKYVIYLMHHGKILVDKIELIFFIFTKDMEKVYLQKQVEPGTTWLFQQS